MKSRIILSKIKDELKDILSINQSKSHRERGAAW